jgi:Glycosyl transferase family 2
MSIAARLQTELPSPLAVGDGNCLFLVGSCSDPERRIRRLAIAIDGEEHATVAHGMPAPVADAFWGFLPVGPVAGARTAELELVASLAGGGTARRWLGELRLAPRLEAVEAQARPERADGSLVAICMATFEPRRDLLLPQLESLRSQTHRHWVCIVSDDCSSAEGFELLRSAIGEDPRFSLSRSPGRLGSYRNFERALSMVPAQARFVALCDQDDRWYPEKLAALIERIGEARLAYSDMRILDESGEVASETFWSYKRNNWRNLSSLVIDNTVTGAASLFQRRLLDVALPFPPPLEGSHHDHWLAASALATGRLAYLDRPLYDYVQHGGASTPVHPAAEPTPPLRGPRDRLAEGRISYFKDLCRIALTARVLLMRSGEQSGSAPRALRRLARLSGPREPVPWLALRALRSAAGRNETLYLERSLLKAIAWRRLGGRRAGAERRPPPA